MRGSIRYIALSLAAGILCGNACRADLPGSTGLDPLWGDLGLSDPVKVHGALQALVARPKEVVPFLRQQLRPVPRLCLRHIRRLILELDSDVFEIRERSSRELETFGEAVEPELRKALEGTPSLEKRRRIRFLLEKYTVERLHPSPDRLRQSRAIEVLEQIGDAPSRRLLELLTEGEPAAPFTIEAQAALQRLTASPSAIPR